MKLPGRLGSTTLGDLLGALHRERTSGVLELVEDRGATSGRTHRIELDLGLVSDVRTPLHDKPVGELLFEQGFYGESGRRLLADLLRERPGRRAGELLVDRELVSAEIVAAALRHQRRVRLDALYRLDDALIRFRVPRPRVADSVTPLPLSPHEFLYGRPRRRDLSRGRAPRGIPSGSSRAVALALLGLPANADARAIRSAFRRLAAERHPDRFPQASEQQQAELVRRFAELTAAYHSLVG
jgi:hypothetical protein